MDEKKQIDYKEFARQMRQVATVFNGTEPAVVCSKELWEYIASMVESFAGYRKQSEEMICGNSVERWKVKINRFVLDGLRQGATTTVIAEYIVDSILEEAICAIREDEECRKQRVGEWIDNYNGTFTCTVCGGRASKMNYCGRCGAKMKGGAE